MTVEFRGATDDDLAQIVALDYRNFGVAVRPGKLDLERDMLDMDRFVVGVDRDQSDDLVAIGGSYEMELTVPGGATIPVSGVTWVSVVASHRRRGLLRKIMTGLDRLSADFDEPAMVLTASEGPIYERFGYGIATRNRVIELDRRRAQIVPELSPDHVRLIDATDHVDELMALYDRYRVTQPGEVSRSEALFRESFIEKNKANFAAVHPDGYAIYSVEEQWNNSHPAHVVTVKDFIAVTAEAHLALWHLLLSIDLAGPIRTMRSVSHDDALPYLLTDQRALRTVEANDVLWLKVTDVVSAFGARTYRADDRLVIGVSDNRVLLDPIQGTDADPAAGHEVTSRFSVGNQGCEPSDDDPDLVVTEATLGPLLMGVPASQLAAGRRIRASAEAVARADVVLGTGLQPHCRTPF